jgi:hypothetical protein
MRKLGGRAAPGVQHRAASFVLEAGGADRCRLAAALAFDEMERQIDRRSHTPRGEEIAIVDHPHIGMHDRPEFAQLVKCNSMGDRRTTAQHVAGGEEHHAGADARNDASVRVSPGNRLGQDAALGFSPRSLGSTRCPGSAGNHQKLGCFIEDAVGMKRHSVRGHDRPRLTEGDQLHRETRGGENLKRCDGVELVDSVVDQNLNLFHRSTPSVESHFFAVRHGAQPVGQPRVFARPAKLLGAEA